MLTFYYHPLSPIARRVWICLLEKQIPFESKIVQLQHKEQFEPEFLALNPFHHVVRVEHRITSMNSPSEPDVRVSPHPAPRWINDTSVD
jgi:glutathione S-transferase